MYSLLENLLLFMNGKIEISNTFLVMQALEMEKKYFILYLFMYLWNFGICEFLKEKSIIQQVVL